jgi:hypothetical protein
LARNTAPHALQVRRMELKAGMTALLPRVVV